MQKIQKTELGRKGEKIAYNYLCSKGYIICCCNWRYKQKEIDIIAKHNNTLVIVEVKTRTNPDFQRPQDAVHKQKQKFLTVAANAYVESVDFDGEVRFDVISVIIQANKEHIDHIEDAFYPLV